MIPCRFSSQQQFVPKLHLRSGLAPHQHLDVRPYKLKIFSALSTFRSPMIRSMRLFLGPRQQLQHVVNPPQDLLGLWRVQSAFLPFPISRSVLPAWRPTTLTAFSSRAKPVCVLPALRLTPAVRHLNAKTG